MVVNEIEQLLAKEGIKKVSELAKTHHLGDLCVIPPISITDTDFLNIMFVSPKGQSPTLENLANFIVEFNEQFSALADKIHLHDANLLAKIISKKDRNATHVEEVLQAAIPIEYLQSGKSLDEQFENSRKLASDMSSVEDKPKRPVSQKK